MNEINKTKDTLDTVTISADYFIRLVKGVKDGENHLRAFAIVSKERDELKAALDTANATNSAQAEQLRDALNEIEAMKALYSADHERMDAAERCIEDIYKVFDKWNHTSTSASDSIMEIDDIICAWRKNREAK